LLTKLLDSLLRQDRLQQTTAYRLQVNRHKDGSSFTQAFTWNVRGFPVDVPKRFAGVFFRKQLFVKRPTGDCNSILLQAGEATGSVGQGHSSDEGSVMERERRALLIWSTIASQH
jgi:hypothetical protein